MNPKEFSWTEDQQVTVVNPTEQPYLFKVHNKDYQVGAGKTVKMPGYIAWMYVYGLATQLAQADGEFHRWNEEGVRTTYFDKLVVGADKLIEEVVEQDEPAVTTFDESDLPDLGDEEEGDEEGDQPDPVAAKPDSTGVQPMQPKPKAKK